MTRPISTPIRHNGFTLVELMVALALGLIISGAAILLYLESKRSYTQDEEMARLQENARFALDYLKREISMSGFFGGASNTTALFPSTVVTDCDSSGADWVLKLDQPLELVNDAPNGGSITTLSGTTFSCLPASSLQDSADVFSIKRTADRATLENGSLVNSATMQQWYLKKYDYTSLSWSYLTSAPPSDEATPGSTFDYWQYYANIYYIRNYSITNGDEIPTLCTASLVNSEMISRCLIEGIEDIQLEIGIDNDGDNIVDQYKNAPSASDFNNALSVRMYILARSINEVPGYTNNKRYHLGVKTINPFNDGYIRRVFSTTIKLRNVQMG